MRGVSSSSVNILRNFATGGGLEAGASCFSNFLLRICASEGERQEILSSRLFATDGKNGLPSSSDKPSPPDDEQDKKNQLSRWWQAFSEQSRSQAEIPRKKGKEGGGSRWFIPKGDKQLSGQDHQESSNKETINRWLLSSTEKEGSTEPEREEITSRQVGARWLASAQDKSFMEQEWSDLSRSRPFAEERLDTVETPWFGFSKERMSASASEKERLEVSMQRLELMTRLGDKSQASNFLFLPPKDNLLRKYFHWDNLASAEKHKITLTTVRREFQIHKTDCGSSQVQIAQLTTKIKYMTKHMEMHRKDLHSRKGLEAMVQQRRKILKYLRRKDWDAYCDVISKLGLRDNVMEPQKC